MNDMQVVAGLRASTTNDYLVTSMAWKCTSQTPASTWTQPSYSDALWPSAVNADPFNMIHGPQPPLSPAAQWIWTDNSHDPVIDTTVYCRGRFRE